MSFAWTIVALVVVLGLCWRFLGSYMVAVYEGRTRWLRYVERPIYRALKLDPEAEQPWQRYAASLVFSASRCCSATGSSASRASSLCRTIPPSDTGWPRPPNSVSSCGC